VHTKRIATFIKLIVTMVAILAATTVRADGRNATHNLFTNLTRAKATLSVNESNALVAPTLVRGFYALSTQTGKFVGFVNEAGSLFGDSRGFMVVSTSGVAPRPLALDEQADLRSEVMAAVDYDRLVRVRFGDGGGRKIVVFSAVDCPVCKQFETAIRATPGLNTTLYVVPSTLQPISGGGWAPRQVATRIWCSDDRTAAWEDYWSKHQLPPNSPASCQWTPQSSETAGQYLQDILKATGARMPGFPHSFAEDGSSIPLRFNDAAFMVASYGHDGLPQQHGAAHAPRWLIAQADGAPRPVSQGTAAGAEPPAQPTVVPTSTRINIGQFIGNALASH
jgi:hypothetical protein